MFRVGGGVAVSPGAHRDKCRSRPQKDVHTPFMFRPEGWGPERLEVEVVTEWEGSWVERTDRGSSGGGVGSRVGDDELDLDEQTVGDCDRRGVRPEQTGDVAVPKVDRESGDGVSSLECQV